ncbi:ABC transporter permease [Armatimonas rosea]|uniref:ABC-type dipeptide/oligopeptide/nickel transport system permease subunit n=1 Tax=Armatimonas rosea TaxID=685828 RepID=A0A7W9W8W4_ARMRO|nr:ABC transporter permease [Armatimonas rosea]MBB6053178.1 ABC-type dipeptide/oligopeptide/nickel transport system permease subunit [Armatimonas rosea]
MQELKKNKLAFASLIFLGVLVLIALFANVLAPYPFAEQKLADRMQGPSAAHRLGTDDLGRDVLSRLIYGARISLSVAVLVELVVVGIGVTVGLIAGFFGGWAETLLMRLTDTLLAFPDVLLAILLLGTLGAAASKPEVSLFLVVMSLGITGWPPLARLVRGQVLSLRKREFVEAAIAMGASNGRILLRHILPNLLSPIIVAVTVDAAGVILSEATLSFLGIGVQRPFPSWGRMINDALDYYRSEPRLVVWPAVCLSLTVIALNFLGDGLRDALDPRKRSGGH